MDQPFHLHPAICLLLKNLKDSTENEDRQTARWAMVEIRDQLSLWLQIYQTLYDLKAIMVSQKGRVKAEVNVPLEMRDSDISELQRK